MSKSGALCAASEGESDGKAAPAVVATRFRTRPVDFRGAEARPLYEQLHSLTDRPQCVVVVGYFQNYGLYAYKHNQIKILMEMYGGWRMCTSFFNVYILFSKTPSALIILTQVIFIPDIL